MRCFALIAAAVMVLWAPIVAVADDSRMADTALANQQPELKFDNIDLADALDFIRDVSGANLHVDWKSLNAVNITKDQPINLRVRGVTLRKALELILSEAGEGHLATFYVDQNVIEITSSEEADRQMVTRVYDVQDLLMDTPDFNNAPDFNLQSSSNTQTNNFGSNNSAGSSQSSSLFSGGAGGGNESSAASKQNTADQLVKLITDTIRPDIWKDNGGAASIRYFHGDLIVTAPRSVQEAIGGPVD